MRVLRALIVLAISLVSVDVIAARPGQAESGSASLSGTAADATGRALSNTGVQLRNVSTGQIVGSATTNSLGQFNFPSLPTGTYLAEVVNGAGQIVATSAAIVVTSGWAVTGVNVTTAAAAAAGGSPFLTPHAAIIMGAAAAAGVAGGMAMANSASPSQ